MKKLTLLFLLAAMVPLRADMLGGAIKITPATGWIRANATESGQEESPFPTLRYEPKDGRNASIVLTLLPIKIDGLPDTDLESLKRFNLMSAAPYLATPDDTPPVTELEIANGIGVSITNEDPALIGKPVPPNEYRIATSASVLLARKYVIHCTIFYDEKGSADFHEALQILLSATVKSSTTVLEPSVI